MRHAVLVGGELLGRRSPIRRRAGTTTRDTPGADDFLRPTDRILQLQARAGNQAVLQLLARNRRAAPTVHGGTVQRKAGRSEFPPITNLSPAGTMSEVQWTTAYQAARAKPSVAAYEPLFRDLALTVGMDALAPGFVPTTLPVTGNLETAKPGLNFTLATGGNPGHTGWVDQHGAFGVPIKLDKTKPPAVSIAIVLTPDALSKNKAESLQTARHEMVHARHKVRFLEAVQKWQSTTSARRRPSFDDWLKSQAKAKRNPMSAVDVALFGAAAKDAQANTEVLAYAEGFMTDFHRRPATEAGAVPAFFELLGMVETRKLFTWKQADPAVQVEALDRLRDYHATLPVAHQRLWKLWLDKQLPRVVHDRTGRKDFLQRLTAFVT